MAAIAALAVVVAGIAPAAGQPCSPQDGERVVISGAADWRTLETESGERLTPSGIADFSALATGDDAPQTAARTGRGLNDFFAGLVGKPLGVRYLADRPDRRGRRPVLLFLEDRLVQVAAVADGLAVAYPTADKLPCSDRLLAAERMARAGRRGFWKNGRAWIVAPRADQFSGRMNRFVILEGQVVSVGTRRNRTYLNFGGRWASDVTVEVPSSRRESLGGTPVLEAYRGRWLRIRGFAVEKSGPMIEVRHPWQIEVLARRRQ